MLNIVEEAQNGRIEGVRRALAEGANVNQKAANGDTALLWAAWLGKTEMARLLLEHGADISLGNSNGTPVQLAMKAGHTETTALLLSAATRAPNEPMEKWEKMGASSVAHVGIYRNLDKKITTVFNFISRDRTIISESLTGGTQGVGASTSFDVLPREAVEQALEQFSKLGGKADKDYVLSGASSLGKPKLKLQP